MLTVTALPQSADRKLSLLQLADELGNVERIAADMQDLRIAHRFL